MNLSEEKKALMHACICRIETGSSDPGYSVLAITKDRPGGFPQISYGRCQFTEYATLQEVLNLYLQYETEPSPNRSLIASILPRVGDVPQYKNTPFMEALKRVGNTPAMQRAQDTALETMYFLPAVNWALRYDFHFPLSVLVIYDSFVQSGRVHYFLRQGFKEKVPVHGGNEESWIRAYLTVRHEWLSTHRLKPLRNSAYRVEWLLIEVSLDNWNLDTTPIFLHHADGKR